MTSLTEEEFSKHVGTRFTTTIGEHDVELTLAGVQRYMPGVNEERGMERFSVFFAGPAQPFLDQMSYVLRHEQMGEFPIFLGAVASDAAGYRYEAVFNYYKDKA